ncbi:MAG: DUF499 domain-containing protein [Chloroflexota bacterium]
MPTIPWMPWHKVVSLRDDLRSGELSLAVFAADLYDVQMQKGRRPIYEDPAQFFALTYPTYNLRELVKDVALRLAGRNEKAVRQLELTYGGGKTHTLIALYHLVNQPKALPDLPAVQEFIQHIGITPPPARVAALTFDKLDVEKGMQVRAPNGETRWLKQPWSVLAYQIGGPDGLRLLHAEGLDVERDSAPAENLLAELLALPGKQGLATLILIDEVLMYAREKIGLDPAWRGRLVNFFQYLTQAVTRVDRAALVASLLATDPRKSDSLGKEITQELYAIFRREREEGVQPVVKEDVAEVLRRRFFTTKSIRDREAFRPHVVAALKGISDLDEQTHKEGKAAEERYLKSYPFHPDLTEIFYTKWTNLEGFQRTRGVLRTFALALRDAESWDQSPLVAANVFLGKPAKAEIGEAARELTSIAGTEEYEGKRQEWTAILQGELEKAQEIQRQFAGVGNREVEQAVLATFLHSQPIGQKALTRELLLLTGHTRPDKIELEKALRRWADTSWFLDEAATQEAETAPDGSKGLPKSWRLGSRPNLRQMHHDACQHRVPPELVSAKLLEEIQKLKSLTAGASAAGARVHNLPDKPSDVEDDGEFHYGVLGPKAACDPGKPSPEARRFLEETTGSDRPRVYRNAVILSAPSKDGLEMARSRIVDYLGWEEVRSQLKTQELDPLREQMLAATLEGARKSIPEAIRQAYSVVVAVSEKNEIQAFKVTIGSDPLFKIIKDDVRSRIQDTAISAEALLPEGPYDLWRAGETARRMKDLEGAFAQFPQLPKMLNRKAIHDTLIDGCIAGFLVLRLVRPDKTFRTFWRQRPDDVAIKEPALEVVLPENAALSELPASLLAADALPGLWSKPAITLKELLDYFSGSRVVQVQKQGYEEPLPIPRAERNVVTAAVSEAVKEGKLWLTSGPASIWAEEIPAGLLTDDAMLHAPPQVISSIDVLPDSLPAAWQGETTTALAISAALSQKAGQTIPWRRVRDAIDGAYRARYLETALDSATWPCEYPGAQTVKLRVASKDILPPLVIPPLPPAQPLKPGVRVAEADLRPSEIQDLADAMGELTAAAAGNELKFHLRIELGGAAPAPEDVVKKVNKVLAESIDKLEVK